MKLTGGETGGRGLGKWETAKVIMAEGAPEEGEAGGRGSQGKGKPEEGESGGSWNWFRVKMGEVNRGGSGWLAVENGL